MQQLLNLVAAGRHCFPACGCDDTFGSMIYRRARDVSQMDDVSGGEQRLLMAQPSLIFLSWV